MSDEAAKHAVKNALGDFAKKSFSDASVSLLESLGYRSEKRLELKPNTPNTFLAQFADGRTLNPTHALLDEWQTVDFLFQLTEDEIKSLSQGKFIFEGKGKYNNTVSESYLFFAIALKESEYTRTQLSGITREINKLFRMPAMLLFRHGDTLTLSIIPRRLHKRDESKDVLEKVTLIKDIRIADPHRAHIEILFDLSLAQLHEQHHFTNWSELQAAWQKTLDSSELNKRFFQEIANWYFWASDHVKFPKPKDIKDADAYKAQSLIRLITRLIFCWFVKEKGLLPDDLFNPVKLQALLKEGDKLATAKQTVYYKAILQNLFFATLNREMNTPDEPDNRKFRGRTKQKNGRDQHHMIHNVYRYEDAFQDSKKAVQVFSGIPFLNGGLFECLDRTVGPKEKPEYVRIDGFSDRDDNPLAVPDFLFFGPEKEGEKVGLDWEKIYGRRPQITKVRGLIHTFYHYKFTITENTPIEEEIALDPELAGKVFENLLAAYNPETATTARKQTGSFFTPREIVNYMVDEALIAFLKTDMEAALPSAKDVEARHRHLFAYNDEPHQFTPREVDALIAAIDGLKSLDPAVGSGAFPMGILHKLVFILGKLDPRNEKWKERQIARVHDTMATAETIEDATARERAVRELEQQITDINEAFEHNELDYGRKLYLIENCIYGVDIQPIAVQIAKMRFFISLIVDQKIDDTQPNRGVRPLPNLETKFVAANTLIGVNRPGQQLLRNHDIDAKEAELRRVRERHFIARTPKQKAKCREDDARLRGEIAELLKGDGWDTATARILADWNPYDQNAWAGFFDAEWMFGITDGFDVAIANPPYVRQEAIKDLKPLLKAQGYECFEGVADLFVYFYEKSVKLLRTGGVLSFISSNKYYRAGYGEKLRAFLARELTLHQLLDFGDAPVFDAIAYASILIGSKSAPGANATARAHTWQLETPLEDFAEVLGTRGVQISQSELKPDGWRLESPAVFRLLETLRKAGKPLGEYVNGKFYRGVVTGLNEAFVIDRVTRDFLVKEDKNSARILKPLLLGRHVRKWKAEFPDLYLCFIVWDLPIEKYPAVLKHLKKFEEQLKARPEVREGRFPWFALSRYGSDFWQEFETAKIIYPDIYEHQSFAWDESKSFLGNTVYFIPTNEKWLNGLLNSNVVEWFYSRISNKVRGGYLRAFSPYMEQIPIPAVASEKQKPVEKLVERILAAKQKNPAADTTALEREIDQQVYALYGLTPEEIKIVEEVRQ